MTAFSSKTPSPASKKPSRVREWLARLALLAFSTGLVLLTAEAALRVLGIGAAPPGGEGGDGEEVRHVFFAYHPRLGWDLVPGAVERDDGPEFDVEIRIDAAGLRSEREVSLERVPGARRIAAIGDSFTFGHGVEVSEAWPARLAAELPATEVVNLAVTGYGTDQQLLRLEDRGFAYRPDLVLLGLFEGDVFRNDRTDQLGYPKPRFELRTGGELELVNVPVPRLEGAPSGASDVGWLAARSRLFGLLSRRGGELYEHLGFGEAWPLTGAILSRLDAACREHGAELGVVILPKDQLIYGGGVRRRVHEWTLAKIRDLAESRGIPSLDLTVALRERAAEEPEEPLYFAIDGHWTPAGHRVAAEAIAAWVEARWPRESTE